MVRRSMRQWQLAAILLVVVAGGSGYFVYHAYHGRLGLMARGELIRRIAELKNEHGLVRSERALWERRVGLLSADKLDPDFLEEQARDALNWSHGNDVVIVERDAHSSQSR
ncbi:MAG: septum formation initiator family protein [Hyphomicrobiales bacterium]|nr:septum formation initiator family protein [Hyphomicrobiales bacterium]OQW82821.1 MAG: hypothetical protein BVN31_07650 [Proteobacteria bacterium ST_bin15]